MMKRELERISGAAVDLEGTRSKRRKDESQEMPEARVSDLSKVKEDGIKLWTTVKEAVNKEGRMLSTEFLHLPPNRQYPDYYQQVKNPTSLQDVKDRLDAGHYRTFEAVKLDLETSFRNAKSYNVRESQIWQDAKHLHKLVKKEYAKMTGANDEARIDVENDADDHAASDDESGKKRKAPNMSRLLKSRLQKLVDKTDDTGRVLSSEFMDLPNKKQWPLYYKAIKKPQCLENIFKRLKRKEYYTSLDFCRDVELVFSNAMEFNAENSQIYEDARILREFFHQLMADLPSPYALPEYSANASSSKIMLKVPAASTSSAPTAPNQNPTVNGSVFLRVPGLQQNTSDSQQSQPPHTGTGQIASPASVTQKLPPVAISRTSSQAVPNQQTPSTSYVTTSYYPSATYQQSKPVPKLPVGSPTPVPVSGDAHSRGNAFPPSLSKSPIPSPTRAFRSMSLTTKPEERRVELDHREGVRTWALRLGKNETSVLITGIRFLTDEEDDEEDEHRESEKEEEEEEEEEEVPEVRKRGRPAKKGKGKTTSKPGKTNAKKQKTSPSEEEISVRINSSQISGSETSGEWMVDIPLGSNSLEVSEKGGAVWKVYLDRRL